MWCNSSSPCPYYPIERFRDDWGESTPYVNVANASVDNVEYCGEGVLFNINSFDQWGVELGKELATNLLPVVEGKADDAGDVSTSGLVGHIHALQRQGK